MDAMSDAIEGADVMLYGVCLSYKESGNCRLECNYGTKVRRKIFFYTVRWLESNRHVASAARGC